MAASEVAICNLALANTRSSKFIESFRGDGDGSTEAEVCGVYYDDTRDLVLRRAAWPFAKKRAALILSGTPPVTWGFSYALPADCLTALGVEDGATLQPCWFDTPLPTGLFPSGLDARARYAIENDGTGSGKLIYMNVQDAILIYTMKANDPTIYPAEFVEAFAWKLAANICRPLDRGEAIITQTLQIADQLIERAAAMSYNEQKPGSQRPSDLYTSRLC